MCELLLSKYSCENDSDESVPAQFYYFMQVSKCGYLIFEYWSHSYLIAQLPKSFWAPWEYTTYIWFQILLQKTEVMPERLLSTRIYLLIYQDITFCLQSSSDSTDLRCDLACLCFYTAFKVKDVRLTIFSDLLYTYLSFYYHMLSTAFISGIIATFM